MTLSTVSVIIPAYKPDSKLLGTLSGLAEAGFTDILVVDDGSGEPFRPIFEQVEAIPQCTLLTHPVNRGKGAALKTAMAYFLEHRPGMAGVVTADADGQHLPADIAAVSRAMAADGHVVLGVRDFSGPHVPPKSRMGNRITIGVFRLFFGMKLSDTQTGLRAFPARYIPALLGVKGDRYEYETHMLFLINKESIPLDEVGIETVYLEENKSSHFRAVRDSLLIYSLILKYLFSSIGAAVVDELGFFLFKSLFGSIAAIGPIPITFVAGFLARVVSSLFNYFVNARVVFEGRTDRGTFLRYYALAALQITLSTALVFLAETLFTITSPALSTLVKTIVDTCLFFFSFRIQHKWVFRSSDGKEPRP